MKVIFKRSLSILIVISLVISNSFFRHVYAEDTNEILNETIEESIIIRTTLAPNTAQDWAIAYKDGIGYIFK